MAFLVVPAVDQLRLQAEALSTQDEEVEKKTGEDGIDESSCLEVLIVDIADF